MTDRCPNSITLDATTIGSSGVVVPRDIDNTQLNSPPRGVTFADIDSYELASRSVRSDWVVKVINDADNPVDVTAGVSTADDAEFDDWTTDGSTQTASTGSPPDNVVHISGSTVAGALGVKLVADPAPTAGTVTVIFGGRLYGGA